MKSPPSRGPLVASLATALVLAAQLQTSFADSTIFGGGPFYSGGTGTMNILRASGFTTVMLWCIHVDSTSGNLILNDQLVASNGVYVGTAAWPGQLATLKVAPTSVKRIEVSVGSYGVNDFLSIQTLMNTYGTNTDSILYRNFQALKTATGADAIDYDDETQYDAPTAVKFGKMLSTVGYKITLCPYTNPSFWQSVYNQLGPGIVDAVYLQCYAGGSGNSPSTWNAYFSGLTVQPGMWCKNGSGCSSGSSASDVQTQMTAWRISAGVKGGFMWLYDDMLSCTAGGTPADYARAINTAVDPLLISPSTGFSGVASYNLLCLPASTPFTLTNTGSASQVWKLVNTSAWLNVSISNGTVAASGSALTTVSLNTNVATALPLGTWSASIVFSNQSSGAVSTRGFQLNTAIANWPLTVTNGNAALLASASATPANPGGTAFDIPNNYCFYQTGLSGSGRGLPATGVFASLSDSATAFQIGPYGVTNALLVGYNFPKSATFALATPQSLNSLAVLAASANGGGLGTFVLNFANSTKSPVFSFNAQDWFFTVTNVALQGFGRLKLGASFTIEDNGDSNPNLYQTTINLAALGLTLPVASITFSNPASAGASQNTAIFAVSGMGSGIQLRPPATLTAAPGTNGTVRLDWSVSTGATNYVIKRSQISGGPFTLIASTPATSYTSTGLANGTTYYFVVAASGTSNQSTNSSEASAMPGSYRGWTLGAVPAAYWPLDEAAGNVAYDLVAGSNGVYSGGCTQAVTGVAGAGFISPHRAVRYNGSSGYTLLPRIIGSTNFSIVFWVLTTATGGTPNWYNGAGLIDGEVGGVANDFGVALLGSKVGFGVGNPDLTLTSARSINNNLWHHVVVTRDAGSGAMKIYIDGTLDGGATGPPGPRTTPPNLRIGCIQTGGNYFNGGISDVVVYNQVLTANEVATLYSAATGLFYNVTLTNKLSGENLTLSWPGNGKLLEATNLYGPWLTNAAPSPVTVLPLVPQKFYRVQSR